MLHFIAKNSDSKADESRARVQQFVKNDGGSSILLAIRFLYLLVKDGTAISHSKYLFEALLHARFSLRRRRLMPLPASDSAPRTARRGSRFVAACAKNVRIYRCAAMAYD